MKDTRTTEYLEKLGKVSLSSDTKLRMRDELSSFADFHAVRVVNDERSIVQVQRNSVFTLFTNSKLRIMKATLLLALMVGMGGTSFAAQGAVPGDLLYPVKVHVNENVRSSLAVGADAEAQLQAQFLAERLQEAEKLAAEGKLKGEVAADVKTNIQSQFEKMLVASTQANAQTKASVQTSVSTSLSAFSMDLEGSTDLDAAVVSDYKEVINSQISSLIRASSSTSADIKIGAEAGAQSLIENAEARIDDLKTTIQSTADLSAEAKADFEADVQTSVNYLGEASASLKANAEADAKAKAESALEVIGKVESALDTMVGPDTDTSNEIDVNLNGSGSVGGGVSGNSGSLEGGANVLLENEVMTDDIKTQIDAALDSSTNINW